MDSIANTQVKETKIEQTQIKDTKHKHNTGYFEPFQQEGGEITEIVSLLKPEFTPSFEDRRKQRIESEEEKFDPDHYLYVCVLSFIHVYFIHFFSFLLNLELIPCLIQKQQMRF